MAVVWNPWGLGKELYRTTLRKYPSEGRLTRDQERHLARLAARLGLDAERAVRPRHDGEDEPAKCEVA